jgi:HAD superfamily hydrolase (TIGR01490 family)
MNLTLFDLDGTLIPKDSDHAFGEFLVTLGWADEQVFRERNDAFYQDYLEGRLDLDAYVDFATLPWRSRPPEEQSRALSRFVEQVVQPMLPPAAIQLVRSHQRGGDLIAIVTATNDFVTRPIADRLGVDVLIATELERDGGGGYTGRVHGTPSYREGKVTRVEDWLSRQGLKIDSFDRSTFYGDSINDLPLLERVSHPVATNPGPALERIAQDRRWPVLRLFA